MAHLDSGPFGGDADRGKIFCGGNMVVEQGRIVLVGMLFRLGLGLPIAPGRCIGSGRIAQGHYLSVDPKGQFVVDVGEDDRVPAGAGHGGRGHSMVSVGLCPAPADRQLDLSGGKIETALERSAALDQFGDDFTGGRLGFQIELYGQVANPMYAVAPRTQPLGKPVQAGLLAVGGIVGGKIRDQLRFDVVRGWPAVLRAGVGYRVPLLGRGRPMPVTNPGIAVGAAVGLERGQVLVGPEALARTRLGRPPRRPVQLARDRRRQVVVIDRLEHSQDLFRWFAGDREIAFRLVRFVDP